MSPCLICMEAILPCSIVAQNCPLHEVVRIECIEWHANYPDTLVTVLGLVCRLCTLGGLSYGRASPF